MKRFYRAALLLAALIPGYCSAQFLSEGTLDAFLRQGDYFFGGADNRGSIYVVPNEINPEWAKPIFAVAPEGVYVSVGAERGLLGAALSAKVTHIVQVDLISEVVLYNQINVVLLKIARDLGDYLSLRQAPSWQERAADSRLNETEKSLLRSQNSNYRILEKAARERLTSPKFFVGSSYLKEPALFARLQNLARAGHIQVLQGNLMDEGVLAKLAGQLRDRGLSISVLDLSNAWEPKYVGPDGVDKIMAALDPALRSESILLATSVARSIENHLAYWDYRGYSYAFLKKGAPMSGLVGEIARFAPNRLHTLNRRGRLKLMWRHCLHSLEAGR